jgi:uncharacterized protein
MLATKNDVAPYWRARRGGQVTVVVVGLVMVIATTMSPEPRALPRAELFTPRGRLLVEVANTPATRARGLSGRERLDLDGLLLEWPKPGRHPIWMADMRFGLDLVWLDADGVVIAGKSNVPACVTGPCPLYEPAHSERSVFVLELPAGAAARRGLTVGASVRRFAASRTANRRNGVARPESVRRWWRPPSLEGRRHAAGSSPRRDIAQVDARGRTFHAGRTPRGLISMTCRYGEVPDDCIRAALIARRSASRHDIHVHPNQYTYTHDVQNGYHDETDFHRGDSDQQHQE